MKNCISICLLLCLFMVSFVPATQADDDKNDRFIVLFHNGSAQNISDDPDVKVIKKFTHLPGLLVTGDAEVSGMAQFLLIANRLIGEFRRLTRK